MAYKAMKGFCFLDGRKGQGHGDGFDEMYAALTK